MAPERLLARRTELQHRKHPASKPSRALTFDANNLVVKDKRPQLTCPAITELELVNAFKRRSLAFDLVKLVDYDKFNAYCSELIERLSNAPPPNYSPVSVRQVLRADRTAFLYMAEKFSTLERDARNQSLLETMLGTVCRRALSVFTFYLFPNPPQKQGADRTHFANGRRPETDEEVRPFPNSGVPTKAGAKAKRARAQHSCWTDWKGFGNQRWTKVVLGVQPARMCRCRARKRVQKKPTPVRRARLPKASQLVAAQVTVKQLHRAKFFRLSERESARSAFVQFFRR